jgi:hypothetical protein
VGAVSNVIVLPSGKVMVTGLLRGSAEAVFMVNPLV